MGSVGVWAGLANSAFFADLTDHDRDPARIAATVVGGLCVGFVAAFACWLLVLVPYTIAVGLGDEGLSGLGKAAALFADPDAKGLNVTLLRLLESTVTDGAFPLVFVALAAILAEHPFHHYVTVAAKIRWRLLVMGIALAALAMAPLVAVDRLTMTCRGAPIPILHISPDWRRQAGLRPFGSAADPRRGGRGADVPRMAVAPDRRLHPPTGDPAWLHRPDVLRCTLRFQP